MIILHNGPRWQLMDTMDSSGYAYIACLFIEMRINILRSVTLSFRNAPSCMHTLLIDFSQVAFCSFTLVYMIIFFFLLHQSEIFVFYYAFVN